ncbi:MAG: 2Fe-2S iron-sulfur cluster-binding protein [Arenibacterium sp.]
MSTFQARITNRKALTDRICAFEMEHAEGQALPAYEPGAHVRFDIGAGDTRAYSLIDLDPASGAPGTYRIAVQLEPDGAGGSKAMHELREGDLVTVSPPKCDFPVDTSKPAVLLAGGIGITPLISMANALAGAGQTFQLHYAGRSQALMAYVPEMQDRFGEQVIYHYDDVPETALDLKTIVDGMAQDAHLYICGPRGMIDAARATAEAAGIVTDRVHVELFDNSAGAASEGEDTFEVEVASSGEVFTVMPGQSIIDALEAGGLDVMYDCQRGDCGICQTDVISGEPDHRDVVLSEAERASGKVMQICVSRAKSARLVLDL